MGCCDTKGLMPFETARQQLLSAISAVSETEKVAFSDCLGRVLAEDVCSSINVPGHNNSAMDGYAIRAEDLMQSKTLKMIGHSFAGSPFEGALSQGQCIRIMTGAAIQQGADAVVMQELTQAQGKTIEFNTPAAIGENIRLAGEDIACGQVVLCQGKNLTAADVGLLASLGIAEVLVYRRVKVAVFSTGDELKVPGQTLAFGDIYDSNRYTVMSMLSRLGAAVIDLGLISDDKPSLEHAFEKANRIADFVVSSGGVSVGDADFVKEILTQKGSINFWRLAIKPGKPFAFGQLSDSHFLGLPGNPVAAMVTFHLLAVPAIKKAMGQADSTNQTFKAVLQTKLNKKPGRMDFQRGICRNVDGQIEVSTTGSQGSAILSSMSKANCYIVVEQEQGNMAVGDTVTILPFDSIVGTV